MESNITITTVAAADRDDALVTALLRVWQDSVMATHHFLTQADIAALVPYVDEALRGIATLVAAHDGGQAVGLMGVQDGKIEMLFVAPSPSGTASAGGSCGLPSGSSGRRSSISMSRTSRQRHSTVTWASRSSAATRPTGRATRSPSLR